MSTANCHEECPNILLNDLRFKGIEDRLMRGDKSLDMLPQLLKEMRTLTGEVTALRSEVAKTAEIVVAWGNIKGFGRAMKWLSAILKTAAITGTACATLYMIFTHHDQAAQELVKTLKNN